MSVINLEKFLVIVTSNIVPISFSFPSPLVFPLHLCYPFSSCPTALGYSVFYSFSSLTLCFSVLGVSVEMFSNSKILSSAMSSHVKPVNEPIKGILRDCYNVFDLQLFFLTLRIFPLIQPIFLIYWFIFLLKSLVYER